MKKLVVGLCTLLMSIVAFAADITGAGATFPYPIYSKWAENYKKQTGVGLNYQSIGSSGGIRQIDNKTVMFGASDAPVSGDKLEKNGQVQFPAVIGGTTKERFEAYSLAASIVGKCHFCVKAHYEGLKKMGYTVEQLRDIGRIAAVMTSVARVVAS